MTTSTDLEHAYAAHVTWSGNRGDGTASYTAYDREYEVRIDGKPPLAGSANVAFRGRSDRHDPEDLFLAAISSCHLLAYLALCARGGVRVLAYHDHASGTLALRPGGGGQFTGITLRPVVTVAEEAEVERARALHETAHERCFIAASCRVPIHVEPSIRIAGARPVPLANGGAQ